MNSGLSTNTLAEGRNGAQPGMGRAWRAAAREPLVHFLLIGAALFAISSIATPSVDRTKIIEVTPDVRAEMAALYQQRFGHAPNEAEVKPLIDQWIRTEVLYREAVALGLDRGDQGLRDRLIAKMNLLVFQQAKPPDPTAAQLQAWFEAHRAQFDKPETVDFLAVPFTNKDAEAKAREAVRLIETGAEPPEIRAQARVFLRRDPKSVDIVFGPGFMAALRSMPREKWAVAQGKDGWYVTRVDGLHAARTATLEENYDAVVGGWRNDAGHALATVALNQLAAHYVIRGASPPG